ncbi:M23/M56 family metallopeptidase [Erythrobacter rubeus]|uniref:Peptidoglycan DD-metalloendopeptidase family protein n=1 Tax=Erythrobacter rubeus TaxID=2760803 RepID=A0ABR8KQ83_9SPHN|nr:M23/M56 family metallopeptidase [Erythrobacter rubeus]MBD2842054.1 peptidoglycan DD-metalloendopeptidase family protein [Erythrobacter rubeus]
MSALLFYIAASIIAGAFAFGAAVLCASVMPATRHWSGLWGSALVATFAIPPLGALLNLANTWFPLVPSGNGFLMHLDGVVDLSAFAGPGEPQIIAAGGMPSFATLIALAAVLGAAISLSRLYVGRRKAIGVALGAKGPMRLHGHTYWVSDQVDAAFAVAGLIPRRTPRIVIPARMAADLPERELLLVLRHEQSHIARRDDQIGLILRSIAALIWFNPFAHLIFARWSHSAEVQCDEAALADQPNEMRGVYANTLLTALHIMAGRVRQYPAASFSTHRIRNEKMRITQIMSGSPVVFKRGPARIALAAVAFAATGFGAMSVSAHGDALSYEEPTPAMMAQSAPRIAAPVRIVEGKITSRFGKAADPFNRGKPRQHKGIDIAAPVGTPINAPSDGAIVEATNLFDNKPNYGIVVVHRASDGTLTLFAHLDGFTVTPGQTVSAGQQIARVGNTGKSTGPHVHIETIRDGQHLDPQMVWPVLQ